VLAPVTVLGLAAAADVPGEAVTGSLSSLPHALSKRAPAITADVRASICLRMFSLLFLKIRAWMQTSYLIPIQISNKTFYIKMIINQPPYFMHSRRRMFT
jgi:hypothetical protein